MVADDVDGPAAEMVGVVGAQREGVYFGFQGYLNLVDTENPSSKVFRP